MDNATTAGWRCDNSYARLPDALFERVGPVPVVNPRVVIFNRSLAGELGLNPDSLDGFEGAAVFAGNALPPGAEPIAQAYAGHQFGNLTMLGDGRAVLLGEQLTPDDERFDIQLKGSGPTPFSRRGDGRAALGPMLREYVISEAMHALGIPTTRSLAVTATGEMVQRETALPGAVLVRVAASHIRVGTFEFASRIGDPAALQALIDHTIWRHYPEAATAANPALALLEGVLRRQARLIAQWLGVGFVHGVMNTDNMALSGESIDFGPCAFLDTYDPATVFSSIDRDGRYAFGNQSHIAHWNLTRFAETLLSVIDTDTDRAIAAATEILATFPAVFAAEWAGVFGGKLGLTRWRESDQALAEDLLTAMEAAKTDFTLTFAELQPGGPVGTFAEHAGLNAWHRRWTERLADDADQTTDVQESLRKANPRVIPRNHLVEAALGAAAEGDISPFERLVEAVANPYQDADAAGDYGQPPPAGSPVYQTFCGT